jgi:hypothetical protein
VDRLKGEKGTTKYAKGAKREEIDISRRRTQTFSSADLAEEKRLALRAGEMIRASRSVGSYEWFLIAKHRDDRGWKPLPQGRHFITDRTAQRAATGFLRVHHLYNQFVSVLQIVWGLPL